VNDSAGWFVPGSCCSGSSRCSGAASSGCTRPNPGFGLGASIGGQTSIDGSDDGGERTSSREVAKMPGSRTCPWGRARIPVARTTDAEETERVVLGSTYSNHSRSEATARVET
jgi:hypothetical protein